MDAHAYISDMLSQLADMARDTGDRRLEVAMRTLAVDAAARRRSAPDVSAPPEAPDVKSSS